MRSYEREDYVRVAVAEVQKLKKTVGRLVNSRKVLRCCCNVRFLTLTSHLLTVRQLRIFLLKDRASGERRRLATFHGARSGLWT